MGWKGDPCWYCRADLYGVLEQMEWLEEHGIEIDDQDPRSFDWHMNALCMDAGYVQILDGAELHVKAPPSSWFE